MRESGFYNQLKPVHGNAEPGEDEEEKKVEHRDPRLL